MGRVHGGSGRGTQLVRDRVSADRRSDRRGDPFTRGRVFRGSSRVGGRLAVRSRNGNRHTRLQAVPATTLSSGCTTSRPLWSSTAPAFALRSGDQPGRATRRRFTDLRRGSDDRGSPRLVVETGPRLGRATLRRSVLCASRRIPKRYAVYRVSILGRPATTTRVLGLRTAFDCDSKK